MTGPLRGAGVAAEFLLRGRWVEGVEADMFQLEFREERIE